VIASQRIVNFDEGVVEAYLHGDGRQVSAEGAAREGEERKRKLSDTHFDCWYPA
jgi:hypothetical protein